MIIKIPQGFDSKFRFILVAAERAKQLQNGAPPRKDLKTRKSTYIAIREVEENLVAYDILEEEGEEKGDEEEES
jgi:DNA-directed RNA polymerase subunit omega